MYSGTTLTRYSGRVMGGHQKVDRVARKQLSRFLADDSVFPTSKSILLFEGRGGPDAIKRKSPAKDEPWHYYSPFDEDDSQLIELIKDHYTRLVRELKKSNSERVAFEAAWLAHALVDGLTPAHHYPYEEQLINLRGGESIDSRTTIKEKLVMHGDTRREKMKNNWKMWGPKGLLTTHGLFEIGVASIMAPLNFGEAVPKKRDVELMLKIGPVEWFKRSAREIAVLDMYENYYRKGWTPKLAWQVRHKLGPALVQSVCLTWYAALVEAKLIEPKYARHSRKARRKNNQKP